MKKSRRIELEHREMAERLKELEEVRVDEKGRLYWSSCGIRLDGSEDVGDEDEGE